MLSSLCTCACCSTGPGDPQCATVANTAETCLVGEAFVECAGAHNPRAFCGPIVAGEPFCLWVSNGCPFETKTVPLRSDDCRCDGLACEESDFRWSIVAFVESYGRKPWTRDRSMVIPVAVNPQLTPTMPAFECSECDEACRPAPFECKKGTGRVTRRAPGTLLFSVWLWGGVAYQAEVDVDRSVGRVCRHFPDDTPSCDPIEPVCAVDGTLELNEVTRDDLDNVAVRFTATFANGATVAGAF